MYKKFLLGIAGGLLLLTHASAQQSAPATQNNAIRIGNANTGSASSATQTNAIRAGTANTRSATSRVVGAPILGTRSAVAQPSAFAPGGYFSGVPVTGSSENGADTGVTGPGEFSPGTQGALVNGITNNGIPMPVPGAAANGLSTGVIYPTNGVSAGVVSPMNGLTPGFIDSGFGAKPRVMSRGPAISETQSATIGRAGIANVGATIIHPGPISAGTLGAPGIGTRTARLAN
jgi:hypothetical protein